MRRCGVSLVFCAGARTPTVERHTRVTEGRAGDAKAYTANAPLLALCDLGREAEGPVAWVGDASLDLVVRPTTVAAPRGAYVVVLEVEPGVLHHACDLIHVPPGATLDAKGILRALVFGSVAHDVDPPPASWDRVPGSPMAPLEDVARASLPFARDGVRVTALDPERVQVTLGEAEAVVPRHWLARMLFRIALHPPVFGYVETYGGLYYDDRSRETVRLGLRGGSEIVLRPDDALRLVEGLYRAVAPEGYTEKCAD
jgi:hypothetical protein